MHEIRFGENQTQKASGIAIRAERNQRYPEIWGYQVRVLATEDHGRSLMTELMLLIRVFGTRKEQSCTPFADIPDCR